MSKRPRLPSIKLCVDQLNRRLAAIGRGPLLDAAFIEGFEKDQIEFERKQDFARFENYIHHKDGSSCWFWALKSSVNGYGIFFFRRKQHLAHRASYILHKGKIPDGLVIDHLCRNRACVNPQHLEAVTIFDNNNRGLHKRGQLRVTHCPQGHEYTETNTRLTTDRGRLSRACRACQRTRYYQQKNEARNELL